MKTQKISFDGIKSSLSRAEMKKIMAGSGDGAGGRCETDKTCYVGGTSSYSGGCATMQTGQCRCVHYEGGVAIESVPHSGCLA